MTCETVKPLLSEFADDTQNVATAWQIQTHLAECASCAQTCRELRAMQQMLKNLPTRRPSARFDASLAQRLAFTRRPEKKQTWRDQAAQIFPGFRHLLRPALALGAALTAVTTVLFIPLRNDPPTPTVATHGMDRSFVAACVAQRRRDAAGEPLADLAAQNLAGHLDTPSSALSSSTDSELF